MQKSNIVSYAAITNARRVKTAAYNGDKTVAYKLFSTSASRQPHLVIPPYIHLGSVAAPT